MQTLPSRLDRGTFRFAQCSAENNVKVNEKKIRSLPARYTERGFLAARIAAARHLLLAMLRTKTRPESQIKSSRGHAQTKRRNGRGRGEQLRARAHAQLLAAAGASASSRNAPRELARE